MLGFIVTGLLGVPFEREAHTDNLDRPPPMRTAPNGLEMSRGRLAGGTQVYVSLSVTTPPAGARAPARERPTAPFPC